jgi:NADH:ubiquinone reductase (H+-translocating)
VSQHAIPLETPEQAVWFNHRLVNACIRADAQLDPVRPGQLHVVIVGAGATELAAELHRTTREVVAFGLDRIDPERDIHITLIEAADRVLPALPPRISDATTQLLKSLRVDSGRIQELLKFAQTVYNLPTPTFSAIWTASRPIG